MNREDRDVVQAQFDLWTNVLKALLDVLKSQPKVHRETLLKAEKLLQDVSEAPRLQVSGQASSWEARKSQLLPYLIEYSDGEHRQIDYDTLSGLIGLSVATIRVRISQSTHKGFIRRVKGRPVVVVRNLENVQKVLDEKFSKTQNPDDQIVLPKRPPKSR